MAGKRNQGSTLLLVVWMMSVLGIVATFLLYRAEVEMAFVSSLDNEVKLDQTAQEVLHERLVLLGVDETTEDSQNDDWYGGGRIELKRNGCEIVVIISDEGSKPNINNIDENSLHQIVPAKYQVNPILDWIDMDDDTRYDGAENAFYELLDSKYKAHNGFISSLVELKKVKDCKEYYPILAPEVTVYGKINLNTVDTGATFTSLLNSIGFEKLFAERAGFDFQNFKQQGNNRFNEMDDLLKLSSVTIETRDKLKPYIKFTGSCNVNLVSENGLKAWLQMSERNVELSKIILDRRKQQPFLDLDEFVNWLSQRGGGSYGRKELRDYFVTYSTIIRYQLWVTKGQSKYYLETVQERTRDELKRKWKVHRLSWRTLFNNDVPTVPEKKTETGEKTSG